METLRKPLWRVPVVLALTGLLCRCLTYVVAFIWGRIQMAQGPNPATGAYELTTGYTTEIMAVIAFLLFWAAGWKFVRGLSRKEIFLSATIMVVWHGLLLALEQLSQAMGGYSIWVYRLYATTDATGWATQILVRVFDEVSVPVVLPAILTAYCYLILGKRKAAS